MSALSSYVAKIDQILKSHPGVSYHLVNYPLNIHPFEFDAAVAAELAKEKGIGSKVFADLIGGGTNLDPESLNRYMESKQLPRVAGTHRSFPATLVVRRHMDLADALHINSTPTVFVMSKEGVLLEARGKAAIEQCLGYKPSKPSP